MYYANLKTKEGQVSFLRILAEEVENGNIELNSVDQSYTPMGTSKENVLGSPLFLEMLGESTSYLNVTVKLTKKS